MSELWLLATPLGNAQDITLRGLDALRKADVLACEDTRNLRRLMLIHGIDVGGRLLVAYHDHNADRSRPILLRSLSEGKNVLYASDAGTPMIADPGYKLAIEARQAGYPVVSLPGASAPIVALTLSGLPTDRFLFLGFPPSGLSLRQRSFAEVVMLRATLIWFEAPHRLNETVADMCTVFGARRLVMVREMTKKFEERISFPLPEFAEWLATVPPPKGEIVLLLEPPDLKALRNKATEDLDATLDEALTRMRVKEAVDLISKLLDLPRRQVYERALELMHAKSNPYPTEKTCSRHQGDDG